MIILLILGLLNLGIVVVFMLNEINFDRKINIPTVFSLLFFGILIIPTGYIYRRIEDRKWRKKSE